MVKKYKTILSVLLVVLVAVSIVVVTGVLDINDIATNREIAAKNKTQGSYLDTFSEDTNAALPLLPTDIENVYYAMGKTGEVHFYKISEGLLTEIPENGSFTVKPVCSGQTLTAEIHYIELDGKTAGYGLFTNELYPDVYLYDYAFFKVTNMFSGFSDSKGTLLMMIDTEKERFYSRDKVYSEIFRLSNNDSHTCEYFLSENQRVIDKNAKMRTDYKMFTDNILSQSGKPIYFFSSRFYNAYDETGMADILSSGGSGENVDNVRYITDIASLNFWRTDNGVYYFEKTEGEPEENGAAENAGFSLKLYDGKNDTVIKTFEGDINNDYIISGSFILSVSDGVVYNILTAEKSKISYTDIFKKDFKPDTFVISENGSYCVVRGSNSNNQPALGIMNFDTGVMTAYSDDIFGYIASVNVLNDGTVILSVANGSSGASYYQLVTNVAGN